MAIIKKIDEILDLIPEVDNRLYGGNVTEAPEHIVNNYPLYAYKVNKSVKMLVKMYKASFLLVRRLNSCYLMVVDYYKESDYTSEYITMTYDPDRKIDKKKWGFETDEIGLRMDSHGYDRCSIYFSTSPDDAAEIRNLIKKEKVNKVVELEPVIV